MKIRLLKDVMQEGRIKTTIRASKKVVIGWFAGTEIEVSDATGRKLIEAGDAVEVVAAPAVAPAEG